MFQACLLLRIINRGVYKYIGIEFFVFQQKMKTIGLLFDIFFSLLKYVRVVLNFVVVLHLGISLTSCRIQTGVPREIFVECINEQFKKCCLKFES